jgi:ubiquinone biosynthesis protein UbiJ
MVSKQTLVLLLLVALLCVVDSRAKPRAPKQRPMKNQIAGQWIITSIIGYPLAITVRFDTNDIHFKYGNNKVIDYTITGTNNIRYKLRKTIRKPNNLSNPT